MTRTPATEPAGAPAPDATRAPSAHRLLELAVFALTGLLALISLSGLLHPAVYARETENWRAQALGQDWVDLSIAVPWLGLAGAGARRGSRSARLVLAGGVLYAAYTLVIYAFAVHFNALFLLYTTAFGLSVVAFAGITSQLLREDVRGWFRAGVPRRGPGVFLITVGVSFALLWLAEIVPALVHGTVPPSVAEAGVPTNPVQALDLSLILPAHVAAGVLLLRRRPEGYVAAPVLLAFGVLMALAIAGMLVVMFLRGVAPNLGVAGAMLGLAGASAVFLVRMLRTLA